MQAQPIDKTPDWRPGLERAEGIAAHPAMRRKTDAQIEERLRMARQNLRETVHLPAGEPEVIELKREIRGLIAAYERALAWRKGAA